MTFKKYSLLIILIIIILFPKVAYLADPVISNNACTGDGFCLNVPIGNVYEVSGLEEYIQIWYTFVAGVAGILAAVIIMWGGFKWLTSRGNSAAITDAKDRIWSAIIGLVLVFLAYTLLNLINPKLVNLYLPVLPSNNIIVDLTPTTNPALIDNVIPKDSLAWSELSDIYRECETNEDLNTNYSCYAIFSHANNYIDYGDREFYFQIPAPSTPEERARLADRGESLGSLLINRGTRDGEFYYWGGLSFRLHAEENNNYWEVRNNLTLLPRF